MEQRHVVPMKFAEKLFGNGENDVNIDDVRLEMLDYKGQSKVFYGSFRGVLLVKNHVCAIYLTEKRHVLVYLDEDYFYVRDREGLDRLYMFLAEPLYVELMDMLGEIPVIPI